MILSGHPERTNSNTIRLWVCGERRTPMHWWGVKTGAATREGSMNTLRKPDAMKVWSSYPIPGIDPTQVNMLKAFAARHGVVYASNPTLRRQGQADLRAVNNQGEEEKPVSKKTKQKPKAFWILCLFLSYSWEEMASSGWTHKMNSHRLGGSRGGF